MSAPVLNIAAYKFASLERLEPLRCELSVLCREQKLKGSILLSREGINLFVAGNPVGIKLLLKRIRQIAGLETLTVKESYSEQQPFSRMLVKIKQEIIAFGVDDVAPEKYTSPRLAPDELKAWLDEGRPVTLLDTRNDYEIKAGTFKNARTLNLQHFRHFPEAIAQLPEELKEQPIVTFCTGGIRCEKAAPFMEMQGFKKIYQLDGGILNYFEKCGAAHYEGECFVFDKRVSINPALKQSDKVLCYNCLQPLTAADAASPLYVPGQSCPYCHRSVEEKLAELLARRQQELKRVTNPLPGSGPYENRRPISVSHKSDGMELLDFLLSLRTQTKREEWIACCQAGHLICNEMPVQPGRRVAAGEVYYHLIPAEREPVINPEIVVLYEDDALVVVNKPAPLPMHPCGRFNRNSLSYILNLAYKPLVLRPAHRLDADTSGVVVFSKSRHYASQIQPQFERGEVSKRYLALVHGHPEKQEFVSNVRISNEAGPEGLRVPDESGSASETRFKVAALCPEGKALLEVQPLTGRTNQIRVHLWELGHAIVGDPMYLPEKKLGKPLSLRVEDPPLCLHAASIAFTHPITRQKVTYQAPSPDWACSIESAS